MDIFHRMVKTAGKKEDHTQAHTVKKSLGKSGKDNFNPNNRRSALPRLWPCGGGN